MDVDWRLLASTMHTHTIESLVAAVVRICYDLMPAPIEHHHDRIMAAISSPQNWLIYPSEDCRYFEWVDGQCTRAFDWDAIITKFWEQIPLAQDWNST